MTTLTVQLFRQRALVDALVPLGLSLQQVSTTVDNTDAWASS